MCFFVLFGAKMIKIESKNPKLILPMIINDFWHILGFFSLFQISDVKNEFLLFKLKVRKNGIFWAKNQILKDFKRLYLSPIVKNLGQNGL